MVQSYAYSNTYPDPYTHSNSSALPLVGTLLADTNAHTHSYSNAHTSAGLPMVDAVLAHTDAISYSYAIPHSSAYLLLVGTVVSEQSERSLKR